MSNQFTGKELYKIAISNIDSYESDECLIWPHGVNNRGYGRIQYEGKRQLLHRFAFFRKFGRYPTPCGLHKCDVRRCYNYRHVEENTIYANNVQRMERGRSRPRKGMEHGRSKLTDDQVRTARSLHSSGVSHNKIAGMFNVHSATIDLLIKGKSWKHVE